MTFHILRSIVLSIAFISCLSGANNIEDEIVFAPSVSYKIQSVVQIGIEKKGTYKSLITNTKNMDNAKSWSSTNTETKIFEKKIDKTKKKTTNPRKRETKPKAGGLFSGVARAFGGDYTGLLEWGGGFIDHMAEPKYNWDVTEVYNTKDYVKTTVNQSITNSWNDSKKLNEVITKQLNYDINKGFINFSVNIKNIGESSIQITKPSFIVHLEFERGKDFLIGNAKASSDLDDLIIIGPKKSYLLPVRIEGLDFITLSENYLKSTGIRINLQDLKLMYNNKLHAVSEIKEKLKSSHVQFDYFDGQRRTIRYVKIDKSGEKLKSFYTKALKNKNYQFNDNPKQSDSEKPYILSVSNLDSSYERFDKLDNEEKRFNWRRWFTSVVDDNGQVFDANPDNKVFPGYSVKLGYYGAKDILPPSVYKPVVYQKTVNINTKEYYSIPINLEAGDIIEFNDISIGDTYYLNKIEFELAKSRSKEVFPSFVRGQGFSGSPMASPGFGGRFSSKFHLPTYNDRFIDDNFYKMIPTSAKLAEVDPKIMFVFDDKNFKLEEDKIRIILQLFQLEELHKLFSIFQDISVIEKENFNKNITINLKNNKNFKTVFEEHYLKLRPGETLKESLLRALSEEKLFRYEVTENIKKDDNHWRFLQKSRTVKASFIQLPKDSPNLNTHQNGYFLGNGAYASHFNINTNLSPSLGPVSPFSYGTYGPPSGQEWPLDIGMKGDIHSLLMIDNLSSPFVFLKEIPNKEIEIKKNIGFKIKGTLRVIRY